MFDIFGGMFDMNGDGKMSADDEFLAYMTYNEVMRDGDDDACDDGDDSENL